MNQNKILENLIVLEGLDGAGTSTQLQLLDKKLSEIQVPHICTYEPTNGFIGRQIKGILKKNIKAQPVTLALLFAADRSEHIYSPDGILAELAQGKVVISDRYLFSSLAYQSIDCNFEWVQALNALFPLPNHLFFIDTPPEICQQRLFRRNYKELFDAQAYQQKVHNAYKRVLDLYSQSGLNIHILDGALSIAEIFQQIWTILSSLPIIRRV